MKKYLFLSLTLAALLVGSSSMAQSKKEKEEARTSKKRAESEQEARKKQKEDEDILVIEDEARSRAEAEESEEIIVRKKGDKNTKVTIEINGKDVKINGKPIEDFEDENVAVLRRNQPRWFSADSRFRSMAPAIGFNGFADNYTITTGNKAFLGVTTKDVDGGIEIESVIEGSAAEKAGLKEGDIIIAVDDKKIVEPSDLTEAIGKYKPEDKITVTYQRDGKESKTTAVLGKNKNAVGQVYSFSGPGARAPLYRTPDRGFNMDIDRFRDGEMEYLFYNGKPRLGIKAQDTEEGKGVKVLEVSKESLAEKSGVKVGDIITSFDGKEINSADELVEAAQESREKTTVRVELIRDGKTQVLEIKTPKKLRTANL